MTDFDQRTLYAGDDELIDLYDDESLPVVAEQHLAGRPVVAVYTDWDLWGTKVSGSAGSSSGSATTPSWRRSHSGSSHAAPSAAWKTQYCREPAASAGRLR
jgi:hypothetical protein